MTDEVLLRVDSLGVSYGGKAAVDDVTFTLARGRCLGIIGESSAGKTQAFLAMLGLLPPHAQVTGRAELAGVSLLEPAGAALRGRKVAMIFQDPLSSLTPHMRIGDQ